MKKFLLGLLVGILLCTSILVVADAKLTAVQSAFALLVNGKNIKLDRPIVTINGDYYIPAKSISTALGLKLNINSKQKRVELGEAAVASTAKYSFSNPAPIGTMQSIHVKDIIDDYKAEVTVKEVIRGDEALQMVKDANQFNDDPKAGQQYLLVKVSFKLTDIPKDKALDLSSAMFNLISASGKQYGLSFIVPPDPALGAMLYKGSSSEGWLAFVVDAKDATPKITFGRKYDGSGGLWFRAYK